MIEAETYSGVVEGVVAPAPVIQVVPSFGLRMGPSLTGGIKVFTNSSLVPFYIVANTGNTFEAVSLQIVNQLRLTALGWNTQILIHGIAPLHEPARPRGGIEHDLFRQRLGDRTGSS